MITDTACRCNKASDLDLPTMSRLQALQTRAYFYGGPPLTQGLLSPFSIIVRWSDIRILRVGELAGTHAPSSALPLGATRLTRDTELVEVDLEGPRAASEVVNRILAVPMAEEERDGQEKVVKGPVMGFVWVYVRSPSARRLPPDYADHTRSDQLGPRQRQEEDHSALAATGTAPSQEPDRRIRRFRRLGLKFARRFAPAYTYK